MPDPLRDSNSGYHGEAPTGRLSSRMSVPEIARRLDIGRLAVYAMLEQGIIPGIRLGHRWIITRCAYDQWERTCGMPGGTGLPTQSEVMVVVQ
jgi:excisionase family DNA binding protein